MRETQQQLRAGKTPPSPPSAGSQEKAFQEDMRWASKGGIYSPFKKNLLPRSSITFVKTFLISLFSEKKICVLKRGKYGRDTGG